jgi:predicted permease
VLFLLFAAFPVGTLVYELRTGKLLSRGWKVIERREDNPMLYWSSIALESLIAFFLLCLWILIFLSRND